MSLNLIYACSNNNVIGYQNQLPWHLPEDLAHFKRMTLNCPVLMGRKTWDSLPARFRPLPNRLNIILTRQNNWNPFDDSDNQKINSNSNSVLICHSLENALTHIPDNQTAWIIGGADLYIQALPFAQKIVMTKIHADFQGDAFAPLLGNEWQLKESQAEQISKTGLRFSILVYEKIN